MSDTKFIYVREEAPKVLDKNGEPAKDKDGNLITFRGFPVGCFAYRIVSVCKAGEEVGLTLQYGYSVFNPSDKFNRRDARVIAEYRLITDCRAAYATPHWHVNDHLAQVMSDTASTEIHQWARNEDNYPQPLPQRFRKACARMANHLRNAKVKSARTDHVNTVESTREVA